jgi:hypothetical protein
MAKLIIITFVFFAAFVIDGMISNPLNECAERHGLDMCLLAKVGD